ncbi:sigma factor-like helix-turn-helix DNA-binding protein [Kitasatospora purpeofusca]|uniref:sigma factor-like helix-turn-helix DNA-binding protein n=1 Tax=Kitasatospora purpeofusca TaxID=67352 RepID=UPI002A5A99FE|nr:sigma factor-like helix-turn-helix DNA-binding protein [Kitasatospora purpeofusca]MDY0810177.1 LuxR C-terminal-related transcriptional regulator [Kitasatospora purpeofusca]
MTKPPTTARSGNRPTPPAAPASASASASPNRDGKGRPEKREDGRGRTGTTAGADGAARNGGGMPDADPAALLRRLTAREAEALTHLAAGRDLAETAAALGVTPTTARSYQHRALRKLGTRTQAEIAALAALLPALGEPGASSAAAPAPTAAPAPAPAQGSAGDAGGDRHRPAGPGDTEAGRPVTPVTPVPPAPDPKPAPARPAPAGKGPRSGPAAAAGTAGGRPPAAFEEVYEAGHTRLVQQVFLLTACKHRAVHCVGRAFGEARRHWPEVAAGVGPEQWVRMRAFELALSPWHRGGPRRAHVWRLPHRRIRVRPADEGQAVLPDHDRLTDRDRALLKALRRLSRPQRRALVLHDGLGLPAAAVAVEVESTVAAAEGRVWAARTALAQWVPDLVGPDPEADGFADRLCGLLHRAAVRGVPEPHRPPVPVLRARQGLVHAGRTGAAALLTVAVGGAVAATLAGGGPGELFRPGDAPPPVLCAPVPTPATEPEALLPLLPEGTPSGIHSLWCSPTPGLEPVVVDPPPPRTDGPYRPPAGGRAGVALPPPAVVAPEPPGCASWVLRPCPAEHRQPR